MRVPTLPQAPLPGIRPTWLKPAIEAESSILVSSESELRAAIADLAVDPPAGVSVEDFGKPGEIVVDKSFTVSDSIVIPQNCPYLRISGNGGATIKADGVVSSLFRVEARFASVERLNVRGDSSNYFSTLIQCANLYFRLSGCNVESDSLFLYSAGGDSAVIANNYHSDPGLASPSNKSVEVGDSCSVVGNVLYGDISLDGYRSVVSGNASRKVITTSSGDSSAISGNTVSSVIDTRLGYGNNAIAGNSSTGTTPLTQASDSAAGNT